MMIQMVAHGPHFSIKRTYKDNINSMDQVGGNGERNSASSGLASKAGQLRDNDRRLYPAKLDTEWINSYSKGNFILPDRYDHG